MRAEPSCLLKNKYNTQLPDLLGKKCLINNNITAKKLANAAAITNKSLLSLQLFNEFILTACNYMIFSNIYIFNLS